MNSCIEDGLLVGEGQLHVRILLGLGHGVYQFNLGRARGLDLVEVNVVKEPYNLASQVGCQAIGICPAFSFLQHYYYLVGWDHAPLRGLDEGCGARDRNLVGSNLVRTALTSACFGKAGFCSGLDMTLDFAKSTIA